MTIWVLVPFWRRHALTRVVLNHLRKVSRIAADRWGVDFRIQTVGSEGKVSETLAEDCDVHAHIEHKNQPLGTKINAGGHEIWKRHPDAMMVLGSDDLITPGYVRVVSNALIEGHGCIGFADIAFYDLETRATVHWANTWTQTHAMQPVGAGRTWAAGALDVAQGRLWQPSRDHGLDTDSWCRLKRWREHHSVCRFAMDEEADIAVCDVKGGGENIWAFSRIKRSLGVHASNAEVDFLDLPKGWMAKTFGAHVMQQLEMVLS